MKLFETIQQALFMSFSMFWEVLWPLILGFTLSGIVQAVVPHQKIAEVLGDDSPKSITLASLFGIASSSCSFAAVALARSIFRKGASFTSAMVFEIASTNLVIELGIILIVLMGWQFMAAEFLGGVIMVILLSLIFRFTLTRQLIKQARRQAEKGIPGKMEGHAAMDMSLEGGSVLRKLFSRRGFTAISHYFIMDLSCIWTDITIGFLIAGALGAFVPMSFWQAFFFKSNPSIAFIEGPLIGPLVALLSFVCSVGNVPLAAILWKGGISFGGVASFIFADLIVLPVLNIYRKYYGWKVMLYILGTFYVTMALAGYIIEILFSYLNIIPSNRSMMVISEGIHWNYTSYLNILFLILAIILIVRFLRTGGPAMLKMMDKNPKDIKDCCKV
jgi:uncharacterized protein